MSPRRSSRARQNQPTRNHPNQSGSSSSTSSNRNDRPNRSHIRQDSLLTSATPRSSSDEPDRNQAQDTETRQTRQQKREQDGNLDGTNEEYIEEELEDEEADDGEVTRCICGQQEYPGPPEHVVGRPCVNQRIQDNTSKANAEASPHPLLFETGSLFIQCEICHVWQHGGCVGIMDEAMSPEHYYCEECKESLHKIYVEPTGRRYSKFTRAYQDWECTRPSVTSKKSIYYDTQSVYHLLPSSDRITSAAISNAKRRSTMNSRAAADEDEAFLKAIEESKSQGKPSAPGNGARRGKRGREDSSEETTQELKRRKTGSESGSPVVLPIEFAAAGSDNEGQPTRYRSGNALKKSGRGTTSHSTREALTRDRDRERDREHMENVRPRHAKVESRRGDEVEVAEQPSRAMDGLKNVQTVSKVDALPTNSKQHPTAPNPSGNPVVRRGMKTGVRRGRAGRNQYTKERETGTESKQESPRASHSRDSEEVGNGENQASNMLVNGAKPSKPRHINPNRTSMNDLRKRAAGILEYISRTQVEMAGDKTPPNQDNINNNTKSLAGTVPPPNKARDVKLRPRTAENIGAVSSDSLEEGDEKRVHDTSEGGSVDESSFKDLSSLQMMDVLTRELVLWQKVHGKWGER